MRDITKILQKSIGGGKTVKTTLSAPKTAISIACGRTLLWMFFLLCATITVSCSDDDSEPSAYDRLQGTWEVYAEATPAFPIMHEVWTGTTCTVTADSLVVVRTENIHDYDGNPLPNNIVTLRKAHVAPSSTDRILVDGSPADVTFSDGTAKITCSDWAMILRNRQTTGK